MRETGCLLLRAHCPVETDTCICVSKSGQPGMVAEIISSWNLSLTFQTWGDDPSPGHL